MDRSSKMGRKGITAALVAAVLFGASTPLSKWLLHSVDPWLLAGLLYLGSGLGLALYRWSVSAPRVRLPRRDLYWLSGAIFFGGIVAPVLLMVGLVHTPASGTALLLNAEGVFTTLLAWFAFKENFDRRIALGVAAIVCGGALLAWPSHLAFSDAGPTIAILGACLAWAIDNNLTRKVALSDASWIASTKGLVSGGVNLSLALAMGARIPDVATVALSLCGGLLAYGVSLTLFIVALRHLGTARTSAYFSIAPFFGAVVALVFGDPATPRLLAAGVLMALGTWLHVREDHEHVHVHGPTEHEHEHEHDEHHHHDHAEMTPVQARHSHRHRHELLAHAHQHYPDEMHRHEHD